MAEEINFFQLLKAITGKPALFPAGLTAARKAVNEIVRAQLSADSTTLDTLKKIRALLGAEPFAEALDGVAPAKAKALLTKLDPNRPGLTSSAERIKHLLALADGSVVPEVAPKKPAKSSGKAPTKEPTIDPDSQPRRRVTGRAALRVADKR